MRWFISLLFVSWTLQAEGEVPLTWQEHRDLGLVAYDAGNLEEALSHFEKACENHPSPQPIHFNRGLVHQKLGEVESAEDQFRLALAEDQPALALRAHYQMGRLFYEMAYPPEGSGNTEVDLEDWKDASAAFRDAMGVFRRHEGIMNEEDREVRDRAETNVALLSARYKAIMDEKNRSRGSLVDVIQGQTDVNGRTVEGVRVYLKSKWDEGILAHTQSDAGGGFRFEGLEPGRYQIASALYDTDEQEELKWGEDIKVPTRSEDSESTSVGGSMTLASPYRSSLPSLDAPYDDHSRLQGPASIVHSTDWGQLTDGFSAQFLPADSDLHLAYVAFDGPRLQIATAVPSTSPPSTPQAAAPEPEKPPTFRLTLKGYADEENSVLPKEVKVYGLSANVEEEPRLLFEGQPSSSANLFDWSSDEFVHFGHRNLLIDLEGELGKRISLHEIEVSENTHQDNQDQNQDQDQQQDQNQDQQEQEDPQDQEEQQQQPEPPQDQTSRNTRAILQQIRDKNEEAKDRQQATGTIIRTDKDY